MAFYSLLPFIQSPSQPTFGKRSRQGVVLAITVWAGMALAPTPSLAGQEMATDNQHRGLVAFGNFGLFPENRTNNAVYVNQRLILTLPGRTIVYVLPLPQEDRFAYLAVDDKERLEVGVHMKPGDPKPVLSRVSPGFYYLVASLDGVVYKKLFHAVQKSSLVDLLRYSKTADGVTPGPKGVVFYHVRPKENDPAHAGQVPLGIHLALSDEVRVRNLPYAVYDKNAVITLKWQGEDAIQVIHSDGKPEVISLSQFR
ncbi:MAG: hypothetical protein OEW12_05975 [Deltaproteobacteria bacterium]|nr:hypothetical protein [Deltaproteobacteria bacterium]